MLPLYDDIEGKVDLFLVAVNRGKTKDQGQDQIDNEAAIAAALSLACDEAKDYLKMLHSIVSGEWSREPPLPEDERVLVERAEGLCRRLVGCVAASFDRPTTASATPTSLYGIGRCCWLHT